MHRRGRTFFALLLIQLFAHQTLLAPLAWADCPHHFALWSTTARAGQSLLSEAPLCGAARHADNEYPRGDASGHDGPCRCGDIQGHLPGAVQAPVPLAWVTGQPLWAASGAVVVTILPLGSESASLLPDANAPPISF